MRIILLLLTFLFLQPLWAITSFESYIGENDSEESEKTKAIALEKATLGVFYEKGTKRTFKKINYKFKVGGLKANLLELTAKCGYKLHWNLDTDYDIPGEFTIRNKVLPEIIAEATTHLPIKTMFYTKNHMITMMPMYDKKESDFSDEYTVDTRQ